VTQERRNQIVDMINRQRTVKNAQLMERFDISIETVRRDLEYLEQQGYLRRVYGGAVLVTSSGGESEYAVRTQDHLAEKNAIAEAAAALISPRDSIFLGVGTTVQSMVPHMKQLGEFTVFTNALRTAIALSDIPGCSVVLPGGQLRAKELTLSEFPSEESISHFNIDKAFIGTGGLTEAGITDYHIGEAKLHRQLIKNAKQSIALVDSSKFGVRAMTNLCTLQEIDVGVTDSKAPKLLIDVLEKNGVQVVIAKV